MTWPKEAFLNLRQILTPNSRPATGGNLLYVKADNWVYLMNADGTEHPVGGVIVLPAGSVAADVPAGTTVDTIVLVKA